MKGKRWIVALAGLVATAVFARAERRALPAAA